jgi:hypothetical protein
MPLTLKISTAEDTPTITEKYDNDFINGTLDNVTIFGNGPEAELKLNIIENCRWTNTTPLSNPKARWGSAMASIYGTDKILICGGDHGFGRYNETWIYDSSENTWTNKSPLISPGARYQHCMTSIYGTDKVLLFGGTTEGFQDEQNQTWIYDLSENNWTFLNLTIKPKALIGPAIANIYNTDKVVLFGGNYAAGFSYSNETWVFDLSDNNWTNKTGQIKPNGRANYGTMASIFGTDKVLISGGRNVKNLNETWVYDLSENTWVNKGPINSPGPIVAHNLVSIYGTDKVLLFGGFNIGYNPYTWIYDLSDNNWTIIKTPKTPPLRQSAAMATVYKTSEVVLFGGLGIQPDTWVFDFFNYTNNGTYISEPFEFGPNSSLKKIYWNASITQNTSIKFQLRTAETEINLNSKIFIGPDGSDASYYKNSPSDIWLGYKNDRWVQYKAYLETTNNNETPILKNVTITYNYWPNTILVSPINDTIIKNNKPIFVWNFTDSDSTNQSAFQLLIDDNPEFNSIDYDSGEQYDNSSTWQFSNGTTYAEVSDGTWYWKIRTKDNDDDWGLYSEPWKVIIDSKTPISVITEPKNNGTYNHLEKVSGTAIEPPSGTGLKKVEITIRGLDDDKYWDGTTWVSNETWLAVLGTSNWHYDLSSMIWTSGSNYQVMSRATDNAKNVEFPTNGTIFNIDLEGPVSDIVFPIQNTYHNDLDIIIGTSSDSSDYGVDRVEINIRRVKDNKYWSGSTWVAGKSWLLVTGTNSWSYDTTSITWDSGLSYLIQSRAADNATNVELPDVGNKFIIDMDKPLSSIELPLNNSYLNELASITGVASDIGGSGLSGVEICIKAIEDEVYWDGLAWNDEEIWLPTLGGESWYYYTRNVSWTNDSFYIAFSRAIDNVGNVEVPRFGITFMYDNKPPTLSMIINNGDEFTRQSNVILSLNSEDTGSGVTEMAFSTNRETWAEWKTFNITMSFNLPVGDGEKTIYFIVQDRAGNVAEPVYDTIILDSTPPEEREIIIDENAKFTKSGLVFLNLTATDSLSGIDKMSFSQDGQTWTAWERFNTKKSMTLPAGDGDKTVNFRVSDRAGNKAIASNSIILDSAPPYSLSISIKEVDSDADGRAFELELKAFDNLSGVYQMSFSTDGESWGDWEPFANERLFTLPLNHEEKIIFFRVSDHAGNIAVSSPTKIPEQEIEPEPDRSTFFTEFWNILLIIFILILIVIIAVIVNKKRKKTEKPEPQPEASETVKPGTIPEAVITVGETPALPTPEQTSPQIPEPTVVTESPQIAPAVPEVPTLASSTTTAPGQVPETQQISPSTVEVPLLPAVQPETSETKDESEKEPTPELDKPIDTQMTKQVDQEK